jgi:hypothetical protein
MKTDDTADYPEPARSALESAITALEGSLRADGSIDGSVTDDGDEAVREWQILFDHARRFGCVIPQEVAPERRGGREHDVTFLESTRRWLKFTKPDGCGFTVDFAGSEPLFLPARPLQYLFRVKLQNEFWGDDTRLEGVQIVTPGARIVTSQPDVKGEAPLPDELDSFLRNEFGFRPLNIPPMGYYKSASYLRDDVAMFDVHPANFVETSPRVIVPIDVIMIQFFGPELDLLQRRAEG